MQPPFVIEDSEVRSVLSWDLCLDSARETFREQAAGRLELTEPRVEKLRFPGGGRYRVKGAAFTGMGIAGLRASGTVILNSWPGMDLVGFVVESTAAAWRVGAVTAVALEALGCSGFASVCLFGAGRLADTTLRALVHRYEVDHVTVHARTRASAERFASRFRDRGLDVRAGRDPAGSVGEADLVITMTNADEVLIKSDWVPDTSVVVSMGGGQELDPGLLERAGGLFVDDLEGCLESGDLARAQEVGSYRPQWVTGTLADLLNAPGQHRGEGPTVFIPRGMAAMDVLQAYRIAKLVR